MAENLGFTAARAAPRSIAGLATFRDRGAFLAALQAEFGAVPPTTPCFIQAGPVALSCLAPSRYLASAARDAALPARLAAGLAGLAAVTDQSDQWEVFTLTGPAAHDRLARLVPIDVAPSHFVIGNLASTRAGHVDVRLWRIAEQAYEIATARSYAQDLADSLGI